MRVFVRSPKPSLRNVRLTLFRSISTSEIAASSKDEPQQEKSKAPCRRPLPMSPYMIAESRAVDKPKLPRKGKPTELQLQLAKNPYALALATSLRQCKITRLAMPHFFLQDFELVLHPATKVPHFLPRSLAASHPPPAKKKGGTKASSRSENDSVEAEVTAEGASEVVEVEGVGSEKDSTNSQVSENARAAGDGVQLEERSMRKGQRAYTLLRHKLISEITRTPAKGAKNRYFRGYTRFPPDKYQSNRQWRSDMADWVLELRRRRIVEEISRLFLLRKGYLIPCGSVSGTSAWEDAKQKHQVAALLWVGKKIETMAPEISEGESSEEGKPDLPLSDSSLPAEAAEEESQPPEFATLLNGSGTQKRVRITVYSLPDLLGEEKISQLRSLHPTLCAGELIVVKNKSMAKALQLQLWALQGYMAKHENAYPEDDTDDLDEYDTEEID